ncbi:MAG TPA: NAD(P)H-dependent oxidoreductase [Gemmatimonadaceae bacterium]|nr:MAG: hypothetical protein DMF56_12700 [Acidobacteriota bacterium]HTD82191.1 NAD(P)H-dependent oxidoreductase [Gemmatimonadaceae bacterium]
MKIVAISGSLRKRSSNRSLLEAVRRIAPPNVEVVIYDALAQLPHFNPDDDAEGATPPDSVAELRRQLISADAILISSPEYAHGLPGTLKNMLDWLVSTGELVGKPVALLNAAPAGGAYAQASLLETLRTMNWNVIAEASRIEPFVRQKIVDELRDERALEILAAAIAALVHSVEDAHAAGSQS